MNTFIDNFNYYLDNYDADKLIFQLGKEILAKGFFTKDEFIRMCLWKSRLPKQLFLDEFNSEVKLYQISSDVLKSTDENAKIDLLCSLKGVSLPTASAILTIIDPNHYAIIDIRVIQAITKIYGLNFKINKKGWLEFLELVRTKAIELNVTPRQFEMALFGYNKAEQDKNDFENLYK